MTERLQSPGWWLQPWLFWRIPLWLRVIAAVVAGAAWGHCFGREPIIGGVTNERLGEAGYLFIRLLTAVASPLIFFAVVDAFVQTQISGRQGIKMAVICLVNVCVAFTLGLLILNVWQPGRSWLGKTEELSARTQERGKKLELKAAPGPLEVVKEFVPTNVITPLHENRVIQIVVLAVLAGAALRRVRQRQQAEESADYVVIERFVATAYQASMQIVAWLIEVLPFSIFASIAAVVAVEGLEIFRLLGSFLAALFLGQVLHALGYYTLSAWLVGRRSPRVFLGAGLDAIVTGFSSNSSLATAPLTVRTLTERMGVSDESARLSAFVGTNFNNDGITLYEAMAALFVCQGFGFVLTLPQQIGVLLSCLMASLGMAGLPGSGLIILPIVLQAAGLPPEIILTAYPLAQAVDWFLARVRTAVNVMGDMQVAILLDTGRGDNQTGSVDRRESLAENLEKHRG